jgi:GT2 family glycosyltransferase
MGPLFSNAISPSAVEMVSGAALVIRRDVFEEVGGFSEIYFMYGEDCDLCHKVQKSGWKVYYLPSANIIHYGGMSTKKASQSSFSTLVMQESLETYFSKMQGAPYAFMFRATRVLTASIRLILLTVTFVIPEDEESRAFHRASFGKWLTILRWALGIKTGAGLKAKVSLPVQTTSKERLEDTITKVL